MGVNKSVSLSDIPKAGDELEDYVAALFRIWSLREKSVVEADPLDLLELDIVATTYAQKSSQKLRSR